MRFLFVCLFGGNKINKIFRRSWDVLILGEGAEKDKYPWEHLSLKWTKVESKDTGDALLAKLIQWYLGGMILGFVKNGESSTKGKLLLQVQMFQFFMTDGPGRESERLYSIW